MLEILYQDKDIVVCIKPIGAESEDGKPNAMPALLRDAIGLPADAPIFTVHRLDKQVSGVMVYAKTKQAAAVLSTQMQGHQFTKEYRAVVEGKLPENPQNSTENVPRETICDASLQEGTATDLPHGRWEDLLYHDKRKNKVFAVKKERKGVKHAALRYAILAVCEYPLSATADNVITKSQRAEIASEKNPCTTQQTASVTPKQLSLLQINLETGRTHQIRVQCASRKLPLVGDARYGSKIRGCDIALFSHKISFTHPTTKEHLTFTKEVPDTMPWNLF